MKYKMAVAIFIISSMLASSGMATGFEIAGGSHNISTLSAQNTFYGNVTVFSNGTTSNINAPIFKSGNTYYLKGNINGSLVFKDNYSILNGSGYFVISGHNNTSAVNISDSRNIGISDLNIESATGGSPGLEIYNSSYIDVSSLNITTTNIGINTLKSNYVNISFTHILATGEPNTLTVGLNSGINPGDGLTYGANSTRNLSMYHDSIVGRNAFGLILIGGNNSIIRDSSLNLSATSQSFMVVIEANDVNVSENTINAINISYDFIVGMFQGPSFVNDTIYGNSIISNGFSGSSFDEGVFFSINASVSIIGNSINISGWNLKGNNPVVMFTLGSANITGNTIVIDKSSDVTAILSYEYNTLGPNNPVTINENKLLVVASRNVTAVYTGSGLNVNITSNTFDYSSNSSYDVSGNSIVYAESIEEFSHNMISMNNSNAYAITQLDNSELTNSNSIIFDNSIAVQNTSAYGILFQGNNGLIESNNISLNGVLPNGIGFQGNNITLTLNNINITSGLSSTGLLSGYYYLYGTLTNSTIYHNFIKIGGTGTGAMFGIFLLHESPLDNISIDSNTIISSDANFNGIQVSNGNAVEGYFNIESNFISTIYSGSGERSFNGIYSAQTIFDANITGNSITSSALGGLGNHTVGISFTDASGLHILNNSLNNLNVSVKLSNSNKDEIIGNYFTNQNYALEFSQTANVTIYHNNFENFSFPVVASNSTNISFNSTYPVGGNYWFNYTGTDHNSGPNQDIPGADGIGDTAYAIYGTKYVDHYPLMKPWTRPEAVFQEHGLFKGQKWSVSFNGITKSSISGVISFRILNATYQNYSYFIGTALSYRGGGQAGTFAYNGSGVTEYVVYAHKFNITFLESGLPQGTPWSIVVNGTEKNITSSNYEFSAYNGTSFIYHVNNLSRFYTSNSSGSFTISGNNVTVNVDYLPFAHLFGSIYPSQAVLLINGKQYNFTGNNVSIFLPAGTYYLEISYRGYSTVYLNVTLSAGESKIINVALRQSTSNTDILYYIGAGIGLALIAVVVAVYMRRR